MARSRDWDELQYVWTEWRRKSGQKIRDLYEQLVELSNQAAKLNKLTVIMARSRDWDELQYVWTEWRRKSGQKIRDLYEQLVELSNQAAKLNNLKDTAEYWMFPYDSPTFRFDVEDVWEEVKPLYELMHAYVRRKLRDLYGPDKISRSAPLPAHILGNTIIQNHH
uniref:Angiotensin-converting enzyme n=1 Tax=Timema monikensis TaxID=170555 RepID=A0A7R9E7D5_9NEOP|nr:unnamed protein product [Timema monikensis]